MGKKSLLQNVGTSIDDHPYIQFYVDIEHALPRFGKREPSESVENMNSSFSQKMNKILEEKENAKLESQIRMLYKLLGLNQHNVERK